MLKMMDLFSSHFLLTVVRSAIDELIVINEGKFTPTIIEKKKSVKERFRSRVHESAYKQLDPFQLPMEILDEIKLQKEMNFAITVLWKTFDEINEDGTFELLREIIQDQKDEMADEENLIMEYDESQKKLTEIKSHFAKKITTAEVRLHVSDENIAKLKSELRNVQQINDMELNLVQKWEQTRYDQAEIMREKEEKIISSEMKVYSTRKEDEKRVIHDVKNYINLLMEDYKKKILYWEDRYQTEINELVVENKKISKAIIQVKKKYEKHSDIYEERQKYIDEYRERKAEEQRQLEAQQKRVDSSIRLQAWWRGVMVRKCLGPFKKKKKGKKGKKGK